MNPQEITWLQHAVLAIKGEKNVVTVACVSASVTPLGLLGEVSWRVWSSHEEIFCEISLSHAAQSQPFGQLPVLPKVLLRQKFC